MSSRRHVFISYARSDGADTAESIAAGLLEKNIPIWLDTRSIPPGADWDDEIDRALEGAVALVVVVTPGSNLSRQVKSEWNQALANNLPVIPVLGADCALPRVLGLLESVNFMGRGMAALDQLVARLGTIADDQAEYLETVLERIKAARESSANPERFASRVQALESAIDRARGAVDVGVDERAIARDIFGERLLLAEATSGMDQQDHRRVAGQRLAGTSTVFRDRVPQRRAICQLLNDDSTKLVSVLGRGGIGKSGLVALILSDLEDGRWHDTGEAAHIGGIVYLSARTNGITLERFLHDCLSVLPVVSRKRIADAWRRVDGSDVLGRVDALLDEIHESPVVVLLDNFEDVQGVDGEIVDEHLGLLVSRVLERRHTLKLIITSRTPLRLAPTYRGADHQVEVAQGLPMEDAVAMLRALDRNDETALADASEDDLRQLAATLHGVPRALEAAVSMLANDPFLTVADVVADFYQQPSVLENLVAENFKRLDEDARALVEALAVFQGPMPIVALEYVLRKSDPTVDVKATAQRLVRAHTVSLERTSRRISLHPVDRDFAIARLRGLMPERYRQLNVLAAGYFGAIRLGTEAWHNVAAIDPLLQEFEHLCRGGLMGQAAQIIELVDMPYLNRWGYFDRVVEMRSRLTGLGSDADARNENGLAYVTYAMGRYQEARRHADRACQMARATGDAALESDALTNVGRVARYLGDMEAATVAHTRGAELARAAANTVAEATHVGNLARTLDTAGRPDLALPHYRRALALARQVGDQRGATYRLGYQGYALFRTSSFAEGLALLEEAIALCHSIDYARGLGLHLTNLARCAIVTGHWEAASDHVKQAVEINRTIGSASGLAQALSVMAEIRAFEGTAGEADELLDSAIRMSESSGEVPGHALLLVARASAELRRGSHLDAIGTCEHALMRVDRQSEARARLLLARAHLGAGHEEVAVSIAEENVLLLAEGQAASELRYEVVLDAAASNLIVSVASRGQKGSELAGVDLLKQGLSLCPLPGGVRRVWDVLSGVTPLPSCVGSMLESVPEVPVELQRVSG